MTRLVTLAPVFLLLMSTSGCDDDQVDGDSDADIDADVDGDGDSDIDADGDGDADSDGDGPSQPSPPAEVLQAGSSGLLLRGVVLTPTGVLDPGEVLVVGNAISCVATDCSSRPEAAGATWIDTHGTISPGLIDSHNHLAYNFLPEWVPDPPRLFSHRYQWADDPQYEAHVAPYADDGQSNARFCPGAKWGELRSLVHGTTTIQGQPSGQGSCINWGIRNATKYHGLGYDHMGQDVGSVRDINDADAAGIVENFTRADEPWTRYHWHMAEGTSGVVLEEFDSLAGRDPRARHHQGVSLLDYETAILIHSIPLTEAQLLEVQDTGAMIVWSPSSNIALYGQTAPIARILELDITVGIGPDWTPSGEDDMLAELRYAHQFGQDNGIGALTYQRLWEMATLEGAVVVGLEDHIGQLTEGLRADLTVFGRTAGDPYRAVVESRAADVRLVLIDGVGFYGDESLQDVTARNEHCDPFDGCGTPKYICVQDAPGADRSRDERLGDIESQLQNILAGYGRADDLLPLVGCGDAD